MGLRPTGILPAALAAALALAAPRPAPAATHFLVIEGLGGTQSYAEQFREQVEGLLPPLRRMAGEDAPVRVLAGLEARAERVAAEFAALAARVAPGDAVGVFLIGHGSHDGKRYKFNIPGPDFTDAQMKEWLDGVPAARQLVVSTTSSSGGALQTLKSPRRVVVTATRNGRERNATVFGRYWVEALAAPSADTDKNETVSALEAFRYAEDRVKAHYADNQRLATEHPQIQGDDAGTFQLARLGRAAALASDASTRDLLARREALERRIAALIARKDEFEPSAYLDELQALLLSMGELQEQIEAASGGGEAEAP